MTCFNRKALTLRALHALPEACGADIAFHVYVVDAGSTDGTRSAVATLNLPITIESATPDVFWNMGMRRAWELVDPISTDFYLWLNDDLELLPGSVSNLIRVYEDAAVDLGSKVIAVGRTVSLTDGTTTYGGYKRLGRISRISWRRLRDDERQCDTMNGNCVLIPQQARDQVGISSRHFSHSFGDIDYGLRARRAGYTLIEAENPVGYQEYNPQVYSTRRLPLTIKNLKWALFHPKGVPLKEWFIFCRAHGGPFWLANFVYRYLKLFRILPTRRA